MWQLTQIASAIVRAAFFSIGPKNLPNIQRCLARRQPADAKPSRSETLIGLLAHAERDYTA